MATIAEIYELDGGQHLRLTGDVVLKRVKDGEAIAVPKVSVHYDFESRAKYLSSYLPADLCSPTLLLPLVSNPAVLLKVDDGVESGMGFAGIPCMVPSKDLVFTGRFFLYTEIELAVETIAQLQEVASRVGLALIHRGPAYAEARSRLDKPLAFVCHDSRDKESIVRPLVLAMQKLLVPIWYDESSLKIGDSLRESIEQGLREAQRCIIVITPNFLRNGGWTKREYTSVFTVRSHELHPIPSHRKFPVVLAGRGRLSCPDVGVTAGGPRRAARRRSEVVVGPACRVGDQVLSRCGLQLLGVHGADGVEQEVEDVDDGVGLGRGSVAGHLDDAVLAGWVLHRAAPTTW